MEDMTKLANVSNFLCFLVRASGLIGSLCQDLRKPSLSYKEPGAITILLTVIEFVMIAN